VFLTESISPYTYVVGFYHFLHRVINGTLFGKKSLNTKCVYWFSLQLLYETFLILKRVVRDMIKMYIDLHVKYRLLLSDFNEIWMFWADFLKIQNFIKVSPLGAVVPCGGTDRRTDMTNLRVAFRSFAKAPKQWQFICAVPIYWFLYPRCIVFTARYELDF